MTENFNQLTPAEIERLAQYSEEMGELQIELGRAQQAIGKVLRHGYASTDPTVVNSVTNRIALAIESADVLLCIDKLCESLDITPEEIDRRISEKSKKLRRWTHHQPDSDHKGKEI